MHVRTHTSTEKWRLTFDFSKKGNKIVVPETTDATQKGGWSNGGHLSCFGRVRGREWDEGWLSCELSACGIWWRCVELGRARDRKRER
jgi:hypothetical protein